MEFKAVDIRIPAAKIANITIPIVEANRFELAYITQLIQNGTVVVVSIADNDYNVWQDGAIFFVLFSSYSFLCQPIYTNDSARLVRANCRLDHYICYVPHQHCMGNSLHRCVREGRRLLAQHFLRHSHHPHHLCLAYVHRLATHLFKYLVYVKTNPSLCTVVIIYKAAAITGELGIMPFQVSSILITLPFPFAIIPTLLITAYWYGICCPFTGIFVSRH
jgi:hypothetical protein